MQQTLTASHSTSVQYLSQLPALNANYSMSKKSPTFLAVTRENIISFS